MVLYRLIDSQSAFDRGGCADWLGGKLEGLMKFSVKPLLAVFTILLSVFSGSNAQAMLSDDERMADFAQLVTLVEKNYAPLRWKQQTVGLDWETHKETYRALTRNVRSDREFYQLLTKFLAGLQDAHVSISVPSTYQAELGFLCDYIEGKVLVEKINRNQLPDVIFPFEKGDELVSIDGRPVKELMTEIQESSTTGFAPSSDRLSAAFLTLRRESRGLAVPSGFTKVTVKKKTDGSVHTVMLTWVNKGRSVLDVDRFASTPEFSSSIIKPSGSLEEALDSLSLLNLSLDKASLAELHQAGISDIGANESMFKLPEGAVANPLSPVTSAVYERAGKKIGIVRVPHYQDDNLINAVARSLRQMEQDVDVLVLDQTNNPGGAVSLVSLLTSAFVDKSTNDVQFAVRPSRKWLESFAGINGQIDAALARDPNDRAANALRPRFQYLESLIWDSLESRSYLTTPFSLDLMGSMGMIQPNQAVRFTKPVLILINEFDFSGGDVFPSLMKDAGRAKLFGMQTSGAGGNVAQYGPLTNSYFRFSLTESLIVRANGELLENRGVKPDVEYQVTEADFHDGYKGYVEAFTCEALKMVDADCNAVPEAEETEESDTESGETNESDSGDQPSEEE